VTHWVLVYWFVASNMHHNLIPVSSEYHPPHEYAQFVDCEMAGGQTRVASNGHTEWHCERAIMEAPRHPIRGDTHVTAKK
jgi:hypothetical protein